MKDVVHATELRYLHVVPSGRDLYGAEIELVSAIARERRLAAALADLRDAYELVLIDCPPSLGLLTLNALTAADAVIIPLQCEYYALEGLAGLLETIELVRQQLNPELALEGIALTMADRRNNLSRQVELEVRSHFGAQVFETVIPRNVRLSEAPSHGKPVLLYDAHSKGATSHLRLAEEILGRHPARRTRTSSPRRFRRSVSQSAAKEIPMSSRPSALGRGIGALLPGAPPASAAFEPRRARGRRRARSPSIASIPIPSSRAGASTRTALARLSDSIEQHGVLQPVVVRRAGDRYQLLVGERRWRAARAAGLAAIPAVVADVDDRDRLELALIENVQRRDLNPIELAHAFRALVESGRTQDEIGRRVSLDRSTIANHLRLLELPRELQEDVEEQRLTAGHAKALLQVANPERRRHLRDRIVREQLSVRDAEQIARPAGARPPARKAGVAREPRSQSPARRRRPAAAPADPGPDPRRRLPRARRDRVLRRRGSPAHQRDPARRCLSPSTAMTHARRTAPVLLADGSGVQRACSRSRGRRASTACCAAR